jgi:acyl-coenzyme A thioesterase PaaI-like protein
MALATADSRAFRGHLTGYWNAGSRPNGGYIMALGARAMSLALPFADPFTVTCHFLSACEEADVQIDVEPIRSGRSLATATALLAQGKERARFIGTYGRFGDAVGPTNVSIGPPAMPPPEQCIPAARSLPTGAVLPVTDYVDILYPPHTTVAAEGKTSGRAEVAAWFRMRDGRDPDPFVLFLAADAFAPAVLELGLRGWSPTIELTVHVRQAPAPGWLRVNRATRVLSNGYFEEDAEIWDAEDRLVAQARQFARLGPALAPQGASA